MDKALENIKTKLSPALAEGEPLVCSYLENEVIKYFLAIGMVDGRVKVFPSFDSQADFISFIRKYAGNDLTEMISEESDFTIELDSNNRYIFKNLVNLQSFLELHLVHLHNRVCEQQTGKQSGPIKLINFKLLLLAQEQRCSDFIKKSVPRQMVEEKTTVPGCLYPSGSSN